MDNNMNRRDFVKRAGAAAAGFAIASEAARRAYAQNEKVRIACIGTGARGLTHIQESMADNESLQIVAVCDVYAKNLTEARERAQLSNAKLRSKSLIHYLFTSEDEEKAKIASALKPNAYYDYKEMLAKEEIDAVVIATPPMNHFTIIMDCLKAGKKVFCEPTLVQSVEEGRQLIQYCHEHNTWVQVGLQHRYSPRHNLGICMTHDKHYLGRINYLNACSHRNNYRRRAVDSSYAMNNDERRFISDINLHLNWRLYSETSGSLFLCSAAYYMDIANWFLRAIPKRVFAMGGIDYWRDGRITDDNILVNYEYELTPGSPGFASITPRSRTQDGNQINDTYSVRMEFSSICAGARRKTEQLIQGDKGALRMSGYACSFHAELYAEPCASPPGITVTGGSNPCLDSSMGVKLMAEEPVGNWEGMQFEAFVECIRNGGMPRSHQVVGVAAAITGIAALESRRTGRLVEIDPSCLAFDFEAPSFYDYDSSWGKYSPTPI